MMAAIAAALMARTRRSLCVAAMKKHIHAVMRKIMYASFMEIRMSESLSAQIYMDDRRPLIIMMRIIGM